MLHSSVVVAINYNVTRSPAITKQIVSLEIILNNQHSFLFVTPKKKHRLISDEEIKLVFSSLLFAWCSLNSIKMLKIIIVACFLTLFNGAFCISQDYRLNDVIEPDMIRNTYLRVEKTLWESVVDDKSKSKSDRLKSIFTEHHKFVTKFMKDQLDIDDLKMLINMNGWLTFQSDVINVHRIFVSFQQHLNRESKYVEKGEFNEEVSIDLIDHVLDQKNWPLIETINNLHKVITKDMLFISDISVSVFYLRFSKN